jgi:hypothetical protein
MNITKGPRTNHRLRVNLPVPLNVPETKRAECRRDSLRKTEVGVLKEAEGEFIVLDYGDERSSRIKTLNDDDWTGAKTRVEGTHVCQKEVGKEVDESKGELLVLLQCLNDLEVKYWYHAQAQELWANLLPANSKVMLAFGKGWSRTWLLKDNCT